jgi:hypothetical protein
MQSKHLRHWGLGSHGVPFFLQAQGRPLRVTAPQGLGSRLRQRPNPDSRQGGWGSIRSGLPRLQERLRDFSPRRVEDRKRRSRVPQPRVGVAGRGREDRFDRGLFVNEKNFTSVTFRTIPDVPIRRLDLVLPEGKTSILAASAGLCTKKPLRMSTAITAQNGARVKPTVKVAVEGCKKPKRHKRHKRPKKKRRPRQK